MSDLRYLGASLITSICIVGFVIANAFHFSIGWVLWPCGLMAVLFIATVVILENWDE